MSEWKLRFCNLNDNKPLPGENLDDWTQRTRQSGEETAYTQPLLFERQVVNDRQITNADGAEPPYISATIGSILCKGKQEPKEQLNADGSETAYVPMTLKKAIKERQTKPTNESPAKSKSNQHQKEQSYKQPTLADVFPVKKLR